MTLNTPGQIAGVQWAFAYSTSHFSGFTVSAGPAALAAGKSIACNGAGGQLVCLISGLNATAMASGVVAVANLTVSPDAESTSSIVQMVNALGATPQAGGVAVNPIGGTVTITQPVQLSGFACNPASVATPGTSSCTVTLSGAAPAGGAVVSLSSDSASVTVPTSVTVAAGGQGATFTATAAGISTDTTATLTATRDGGSRTFPLELIAPATLSSVNCSPATLNPGGASACAVALSKATPVNVTVNLWSTGTTAVAVPDSVAVPAGSAGAGFTATAGASIGEVLVMASLNGISQSQQLQVASPAFTFSCQRTFVIAGETVSCSVGLPSAATVIYDLSIQTAGAGVTAPQSSRIAIGETSAQFEVGTSLADTNQSATVAVSISPGGAHLVASLDIGGVRPVSFRCFPQSLAGGGQSECGIQLNTAAPVDLNLELSSSSRNVTVPASATVRGGQISVVVVGQTTKVAKPESVQLTARFGASSVSETLDLYPSLEPVLNAPRNVHGTAGSNIQFVVSADDPSGLPVTLSASGVPPGAQFAPSTGAFTWTPLQTETVEVAFTATNSAGFSSTAATRIQVGTGKAKAVKAVNGATYSGESVCSPGAFATLFGSDFTQGVETSASELPLPTQLAGLRVSINGTDAPLLYVSRDQVNFQCPNAGPGERLSLLVRTGNESSAAIEADSVYAAPGIFSLDGSASGQGLVLLADNWKIAMPRSADVPSLPARPGDYIVIYAQGLGPVRNGPEWGYPAPLDSLVTVVEPVRVMIGGVDAEVVFAGLAPGFVGLNQVNARVPASVQTGDQVPLVLMVPEAGGTIRTSNTVTISIEP